MDPLTIIGIAMAVIQLYNAVYPDHPFSISSWIRTIPHNANEGGAPDSRHLEGGAIDLIPDNPDHGPIIQAKAQALGFHAIFHHGHVHVQLKAPRPDAAPGG